MNDSLDLRNRILKMRESNNLTDTQQNSSNNNLMSKFESSIKDDDKKKSPYNKDALDNNLEEKVSKSFKNKSENLISHIDGTNQKTDKVIVNDNEAQFLMLANKFNEAVEVILELSQKVEKLEKNFNQNSSKSKKNKKPFLNLKILIFLFIIPVTILGLFTVPVDLSLIKLIIMDILRDLKF